MPSSGAKLLPPFFLLLVVVARGLALRVEEARPVLGLELHLQVSVDQSLCVCVWLVELCV